jgi:hypothetical protein
MRRAAAALSGVVVAACGGSASRPAEQPPSVVQDAEPDLDEVGKEMAAAEDLVLDALSEKDPVFALRVGKVPSLAGGPAAEVEANWLSARERAEGLDLAEAALAQWDLPPKLLKSRSPRAWEMRLERELVVRAVREERFRYEHERELPRAASELVRTATAAFRGANPNDPRRAHLRWLLRRIEEIRASLRAAPLSSIELAELDDAMDPLEHAATNPELSAAIARLRVDIEAAKEAPPRPADPREIERAMGAHLGVTFPVAVVRSRLERAEAALREAIKSASTGLSPDEVRTAEKAAEPLLFGEAPCGTPASHMRAAMPPPERAAACALLTHAAARGDLLSWIVLHDHLVVALWAILVRGEGVDANAAQAKLHLVSATPPDRSVRFLRLAVVRPTTAIGAGLAVEMLLARGLDRTTTFANAWSAIGDAPFDVVEREALSKVR